MQQKRRDAKRDRGQSTAPNTLSLQNKERDVEFMPFDFEGKSVRWVINNEEAQAVAQDVCKVLGIDDASQALSRLKPHQKSSIEVLMVSPLNKATLRRKLLTVNEKGLYKLILTSRKPEAERFQDWITDEVLPTIRKTGQYRLTPERVLENTKYPVQIQHTKDVAAFLYPQGKKAIITHGSLIFRPVPNIAL
jgi:prophage antirepressor-like protein